MRPVDPSAWFLEFADIQAQSSTWLDSIKQFAAEWSDTSRLASLLVTAVGFLVTIYGVYRTKSAAEQAKNAAVSTRETLRHYDAIADFASAVETMDEIKRLHRQGTWFLLPDRYSNLRRRLNRIRSSTATISDGQRQRIQSCLQTFARLERRIEMAVAAKGPPPNPAKMNEIVSAEIDSLEAVLLELQQTLRAAQ